MDKRIVSVGNQLIAYYDNLGKGVPVLMLHGNSLSSETFLDQLESGLLSDFRLIAFDLPGHGDSGPAPDPEKGYSLPGFSALLLDLIEELRISECLLVGHSLGGHIILDSLPGLQSAKGIMIFGTPPIGFPPRMDQYFLPHPGLGILSKPELSNEDIHLFIEGCLKKGSDKTGMLEKIFNQSLQEFRQYYVDSLGKGLLFDEMKHLNENQVPVAVLHGEQDQLINPDYLQSLEIPNLWRGMVHMITDAGHSPQMENPAVFNKLLMEFIQVIS